MKKILILTLVLLILAGCTQYEKLDGRKYLVTETENADTIVLVLHGGGSGAKNVRDLSGFDGVAQQLNATILYPQGTGKIGNLGSWNAGPETGGYAVEHNVDDVTYIQSLIDTYNKSGNIKYVFATGISMGGMMSYRLACELHLDGIAPIGATLTYEDCNYFETPILHIHGSADPFIPFDGGESADSVPDYLAVGGTYPSVMDSLLQFSNGCPIETVAQKDDVMCSELCNNVLCVVENGGHTWPGSKDIDSKKINEILGNKSNTIDGTAVIATFFEGIKAGETIINLNATK